MPSLLRFLRSNLSYRYVLLVNDFFSSLKFAIPYELRHSLNGRRGGYWRPAGAVSCVGDMKRIGIIGIGLLGSAVATRVLKGKFEVKGYDTRPEQIKALCAQGLIAAGSIAEVAADTDAVFTILPTLPSVEATILGVGGLIATAPPDCTLIQMSTISPELTRRLAGAAA